MRHALKHVGYLVGYGSLGALIVFVTAYAWHLRSLPDLAIWHTAQLDGEFRAGDAARLNTLADYRALEDRLFAELKREVYDRVPSEDRRRFSRYSAGSVSDASKLSTNWNRTFELSAAAPRGGVLLLHGLTDSPYSMRTLGEALHARGFHVVGLRLPGHGTAPFALLHVHWRDMAAAVRLAARDLAGRIGPDRKLYMIGYSTGAALAVEYALARMQGEALPAVDRLVLVSPAIGVSPAAALAVWQARASALLGIEKLAWSELSPEDDPFKYASFTVGAGDQIYQLTRSIGARLTQLGKSGPVTGLPRILAFQSAADATVSTPAVVNSLLGRLAAEGHELVLFDINRHADVAPFFLPGAPEVSEKLLAGPALPFGISVVTNRDSGSDEIVIVRRTSGRDEIVAEPTNMAWPPGVFSLSHAALPFPPGDPVYGSHPPGSPSGLIYLGRIDVYGERGLLAVPPGNLVRLRHNPFFDYLYARIEAFLDGER